MTRIDLRLTAYSEEELEERLKFVRTLVKELEKTRDLVSIDMRVKIFMDTK